MNRIVIIKIGSSVFVTRRRKIDEFRICALVQDISSLRQKGWRVILVVSGAVALGLRVFDGTNGNDAQKKCAAGIGQLTLMNEFYRRFLQKNIRCGQVLLTTYQVEHIHAKDPLKATLQLYLDHHILPILNENDVLDLYSFGGNDELALFIAQLLSASYLLILSSFDSHFGVGGGASKMKVMEKARTLGISAQIADGKKPWIHLLQN